MKIIETGSNVKNFKECDYIGKWQVSEYFCPSAVNIAFFIYERMNGPWSLWNLYDRALSLMKVLLEVSNIANLKSEIRIEKFNSCGSSII